MARNCTLRPATRRLAPIVLIGAIFTAVGASQSPDPLGWQGKLRFHALAAYGPRICGSLADILDDNAVPIAVRRYIPRVLKRIPEQRSVEVLLKASIVIPTGTKGLDKVSTKGGN